MPRFKVSLLLLVALAVLTAPAAEAKVRVAVGIGDQSPAIFTTKSFKALKIRKVRYFIRWDAARYPHALQAADAFVNAARAARARVLMHITTNDYRYRKAKLPSVKAYRIAVGKLIRRYKPLGVKEWGAWNEVNHVSEPTWKNPKRAAQYFVAMRRMCRGCTVVALDLLDQRGVASYVSRFYRALRPAERRAARLVGIHNYADVNRRRLTGTKQILRAVRRYNRRAQFWFTETGGLVKLGRSWPCNKKRAANRLAYMFKVLRAYRRSVKRIYAYNFFGPPEGCRARFDAGLVNANGTLRPGYRVFARLSRAYIR